MKKRLIKRPTIYDVASEAEVSITTVSRYLNSISSVKAGTASRIAVAMEELDYIPHGNTGSRASRYVGRIGVLTPFYPAPSFVKRLEGMIPVLRSNQFEVVVYTIEGPEQLEEYLTSVPFMRRIDGLILMSVQLTVEQHRILSASELHTTMVETDDENYSRVLADDYQGGRIAADLFIKKDYFPCAYIGDKNRNISYSLHPSKVRLKGFRETLSKAGKNIEPAAIIESDTNVGDAQTVVKKLLNSTNPPRSIFAMSDLQAIGAVRAAQECGIRVPDELAVLGFDNIEAAGWMDISTITQHLGDSGRIAAGLLLEQISGKSKAIQKVNLQVGLIERSTT